MIYGNTNRAGKLAVNASLLHADHTVSTTTIENEIYTTANISTEGATAPLPEKKKQRTFSSSSVNPRPNRTLELYLFVGQ
jgi:hypothetical protein